jgi:hypothetical protein
LCNTASGDFSTVGGGSNNTASSYRSTVSGGYCNIISSGSTASGILGGVRNSITGNTCTFIVGSCITAIASCTTHVNCLAIMNIPTSDSGLSAGMVWRSGADLKIVI